MHSWKEIENKDKYIKSEYTCRKCDCNKTLHNNGVVTYVDGERVFMHAPLCNEEETVEDEEIMGNK